MRALLKIILLVVVTSLSPGCFIEDVALTARDHFEETRPFEPGGTFRLENVNGTVTIATWDQPSVRIEAEMAANNEEALDAIEIEVEGEGDRVEVITHLPRSRYFFGSGGKVEYNITLPAQARVHVETVNGKVNVEGISGQVRASTVNGSVELTEIAGEGEASTVNGSIKTTFYEVDPDGRNRFSSTNGSVTIYLPRNISGEFDASTVNGSIKTDLPLEVSGRFGHRHLQGRVGEAGGSFDIDTVNGSVRIYVN